MNTAAHITTDGDAGIAAASQRPIVESEDGASELNPAAGITGAAAQANAETREILNLLGDSNNGGSCCGGSCCA